MKVRMLQGLSGPHYNHRPGAFAEFPAAEAKRLIDAGIAESAVASAAPGRTGKGGGETTSKAAPAEKRGLFGRKKKA